MALPITHGAARIPISGATVPSKYSPRGGFSNFTHMEHGPFHLHEKATRAHRHSPATSTHAEDSPRARPVFKATALPPAPRNAGAFQQFRYALDPFEALQERRRADAKAWRQKVVGSAFLAGGSTRGGKRNLRLRLPELRQQLHRTLRDDWQSFRGLVADERGLLLAAFEVRHHPLSRLPPPPAQVLPPSNSRPPSRALPRCARAVGGGAQGRSAGGTPLIHEPAPTPAPGRGRVWRHARWEPLGSAPAECRRGWAYLRRGWRGECYTPSVRDPPPLGAERPQPAPALPAWAWTPARAWTRTQASRLSYPHLA